jgi:hypothetical protein
VQRLLFDKFVDGVGLRWSLQGWGVWSILIFRHVAVIGEGYRLFDGCTAIKKLYSTISAKGNSD